MATEAEGGGPRVEHYIIAYPRCPTERLTQLVEEGSPEPDPPVFVELVCEPRYHAILSSQGAKQRLTKVLAELLWVDPKNVDLEVRTEHL